MFTGQKHGRYGGRSLNVKFNPGLRAENRKEFRSNHLEVAANVAVNRAANRVHVEGAQGGGRNQNLAQKKFLLLKKNHKIPFVKRFSDFETDDGRPFAGADASRIKIGDFIAFF
jgi:hypothetical protein